METLQPNSRDCFVCGVANPIGLKLRFYNSTPGTVEAVYTVPEKFQGYPGITHGGIVASMLDEITYRSLIGDDPTRMMYTARLNIRYIKNVPIGEPLQLIGHAGKVKSRTATATGEIYNRDGVKLAEAEALLIRVPGEMFDAEKLNSIGWKVYLDEEKDGIEASMSA